ncbi:TPA_asm: G [Rhododendron delavayi virus 1]|uniref:G n=1 Tax=Rhododendron delavayi virus 1 TaxID=2793739 RepID=A0A8D9UIV9_9RHAB|nr:G [Rhododendron delavayi virus 1] [Rhododendron delavayi virus 1]DAF42307.1 TPA_asm: G [Rhododendron delavayi virus 1]
MDVIRQFMVLFLIRLIISPTMKGEVLDDFNSYRKSSLANNPTKSDWAIKNNASHLYQPYYTCSSRSSTKGLTTNAWQYSCKQACLNEQKETEITIAIMKWDFKTDKIPVYKIITHETCYTSHENIWGYCSFTKDRKLVRAGKKDIDYLTDFIIKGKKKIEGMETIITSKHPDCDYLSDKTSCSNDYTITKEEGSYIKKSEVEKIAIYTSGVQAEKSWGFLQMNEISWVWDKDDASTSKYCGWKQTSEVKCNMVETSDILQCPDIGYSFHIHDLRKQHTCIGEIYDVHGPLPFLFKDSLTQKQRGEIESEVIKNKQDPDIAFIKGVNKAFKELESSQCSAICDLFARATRGDTDNVLDTPIGTWRIDISDPHHHLFIPCLPTNDWRLISPLLPCNDPNSLQIINMMTKSQARWDAGRDFMIEGDKCDTPQANPKSDRSLYHLVSKGMPFDISFWNGDTAEFKYPYDHPIWIKRHAPHAINPGWLSKVKFDVSMVHSKGDVSDMLTSMVRSVQSQIKVGDAAHKSTYHLIFEEVLGGIEGALSNCASWVMSVFTDIRRMVTFALSSMILFLIYWTIMLVRKKMSKVKPQKDAVPLKSLLKKVTIVDNRETRAGRRRSRSRSRKSRGEILEDLQNQDHY